MSGKREKRKRKEVQAAVVAKAEQGKLDIVMLNAIKAAITKSLGKANGAKLLIEVLENPSIARTEYIQGFAERYHDMLVDLCEKMGYGGIYVADPQFGRVPAGGTPRGAFQIYVPPPKIIVTGAEEN
jgi:hypothetical protein